MYKDINGTDLAINNTVMYTDNKEREFEGKIIKFLEDNKIEIKYGDGFLIVKASEVLSQSTEEYPDL